MTDERTTRSSRRSGVPAASAAAPHNPASGEPTDAQLLARSAAGDTQAYLDLYHRYAPRVFGLIVTLLGRGPDADDAFQDAMWDLWRRAASFDASLGQPATWILMIARSRAVDAARKRARLAAGDARRAAEHAPDSPAADAPHTHAELRGHAAAQLAALPAEHQTVIRLAFIQGMTREQIARIQGIPVGTVKTRIRLGVRALAKAMTTPEEARERGHA